MASCSPPLIDVSDRSLACENDEECSAAEVSNFCEECDFQAVTRETKREIVDYINNNPCPNDGVICDYDLDAFADPISQCIEGTCQIVFAEGTIR